MNTKNLVCTLIGAVIGAAIGAAATYKFAEGRFATQLEEEMAEYREYYHKKDEMRKEKALAAGIDEDAYDASESAVEASSGVLKEGVGFIPKEAIEAAESMQRAAKGTVDDVNSKTHYNRIAKAYTHGVNVVDHDEEEKPYLVGEEVFAANQSYKEVSVYYDPESGVVMEDESGEEIREVDAVLGKGNLVDLDSGAMDVVYICNEELHTIFEVTVDEMPD